MKRSTCSRWRFLNVFATWCISDVGEGPLRPMILALPEAKKYEKKRAMKKKDGFW